MVQTCSFLLKSYAQELCVLSDDGMLGKTLDRKPVALCARARYVSGSEGTGGWHGSETKNQPHDALFTYLIHK